MSQRRSRRGEIGRELQRDLQSVAPPSIVVLLWRWRWELGILAGLAAGTALLIATVGWIWILTLPGMAAVVLAWPAARCWAADVLVSVSPRHPQIVVLDIIRSSPRC